MSTRNETTFHLDVDGNSLTLNEEQFLVFVGDTLLGAKFFLGILFSALQMDEWLIYADQSHRSHFDRGRKIFREIEGQVLNEELLSKILQVRRGTEAIFDRVVEEVLNGKIDLVTPSDIQNEKDTFKSSISSDLESIMASLEECFVEINRIRKLRGYKKKSLNEKKELKDIAVARKMLQGKRISTISELPILVRLDSFAHEILDYFAGNK